MDHYLKKLEELLCAGDPDLVFSALYNVYRELHPQDPEPIRQDFRRLDSILRQLPLSDWDQVCTLTCRLCIEHEEAAFLEGLRVGATLMHTAQ